MEATATSPGAATTSTAITAGAATTAPAPAPTSGGAHTGATTETVNPGSWMAGFSDEMKGYISTKGFKDPGTMADSYRNLEKLIGVPQERVMKLPEKFYGDDGKLTPEGRQIYERLGAPKDPKEYGLDKLIPKEGGDPKLMEHFSGVFQEAGVPKSAAEKIVSSWNEYQAQQTTVMKEAALQKFKDSNAALVKDWGAAFEQNTQIAIEGKKRMGHDDKTVDALSTVLGHAETMKLYRQLGSAVGESAFVSGRAAPTGPVDPSTARAQIAALKSDRAFVTKYNNGDAEAVAKLTRLHEQAAHGHTVNF